MRCNNINRTDSYEEFIIEENEEEQSKRKRRMNFERAGCGFGYIQPLCASTHMRTSNEKRIVLQGDRDIIIKRLTDDSRRIVPYNASLLRTFHCNLDVQLNMMIEHLLDPNVLKESIDSTKSLLFTTDDREDDLDNEQRILNELKTKENKLVPNFEREKKEEDQDAQDDNITELLNDEKKQILVENFQIYDNNNNVGSTIMAPEFD
ncbi:unnamed protein product [Didymodactylos carnosus]|uniref:Uncharacterized protein n=1 Tax=Didymodactylos carnosus TaxID=1234261 RepID=A0A815VG86_9BILA|nr:unnamed protein product [Didymodactylos carnosus]CAF4386991.1 unnamed protein product [Didymodactylos carnosus]